MKSALEISKQIGYSASQAKNISVYDVDYEPTILNFSTDIEPDQNEVNNDDSHIIGQAKRRTHGCYLCGKLGHGRYDCTLLKKYSCFKPK